MSTGAGYSMSKEKRVLRWGGLAVMLGGILFIFTIVILVGFVPAPTCHNRGIGHEVP